MEIDFIQVIVIVVIIIIFGIVITFINLSRKNKVVSINKEQTTWLSIEQLNNKKKKLLDKKKELSYKYTAKTMDDETYSKAMKYINEEIKEIDQKINSEVSKLTEIQKKDTPKDDLRFKNIKIKGDLSEVSLENKSLKEKIKELEDFIKNLSKTNTMKTPESEISKSKYYSLIINKYKNIINENEQKTISQMKDMIKPSDLTVKSVVAKFSPIGYDYNKDYLTALRKTYNYLKSELDIIKNDLKVLFWIDFSKIIKDKLSDEQNSAIFLCSIMQALNDSNSKLDIVKLEDDKIHSVVTTKYKNTFYIFDLVQKVPFDMFKDTDEKKLFEKYHFNSKKIVQRIYSYNQYDYKEH